MSRFLRESGCSVVEWDRAEAGRMLEPGAPRPALDAVAVCSPPQTHMDYLASAVSQGLHVLCEKPIVWPDDDDPGNLAGLTERLSSVLDRAFEKKLVVHENTQWLYTLEDFRRIAGDPQPGSMSHFRCELSPSSGTPARMLMECSAHANAMLTALGSSGVEDLHSEYSPAAGPRSASLQIRFLSRNTSGGAVQVEYSFVQQAEQPRHAAYEIDHRRVERHVEPEGYRIFLACDGQRHAIRDPFQSSVEEFVSRITGRRFAGDTSFRILTNIRMSQILLNSLAVRPESARA